MELKKLGRFEIIKEIGAGGMGIVYKGLDPKINRSVALKVIRSILGSGKSVDQKQALDRFYIEAQSAGRLSHHNIVTIYDVGEESTSDGDIVYIAMEYISGKGLDYHIENDTFSSLNDKIRIIKQVAVGLDYAHKRDIVHRDVKPANIILTEDLEPKLMDFGLARFTDSSLTMSGTILGTPNYMAPEQVQGKKVDARSDFFALTVILYEMLTSEKPFAGDTITTVIYRVVNEDPILPCKLNPDLPPSVDQMIAKGLTKSRENRFQSGAEYIEALDSLLADSGKPLTFSSGAPNIPDAGTTMVLGKAEAAAAIKVGKGKAGPDKRILAGAGAGVVLVLGLLLFFLTRGEPQKPKVIKAPEKPQVEVVAKVEPSAEIVAPEDKKVKETKPPPAEKPAKPKKVKAAKKHTERARKKARPKVSTAVAPKQEKAEAPSDKKGLLTVISKPSGAEVFVGSEFIGLTPVNNLKFRQGGHNLKIIKKGYQTYLQKIELRDKNRYSVSLTEGKSDNAIVEKAAPKTTSGGLDVFVPPKSVIYIDGKEYRKERVTLFNLSPGSHMVYIQMKGSKPYNKRITITKGKTETIDVR